MDLNDGYRGTLHGNYPGFIVLKCEDGEAISRQTPPTREDVYIFSACHFLCVAFSERLNYLLSHTFAYL